MKVERLTPELGYLAASPVPERQDVVLAGKPRGSPRRCLNSVQGFWGGEIYGR